MQFPQPLQAATLIRRYKRFLADVKLDNGEQITLHCPNTGSMQNCQSVDSPVWFTDSRSNFGNDSANTSGSQPRKNPRKYPCTWQIVQNRDGQFVGVNTGLANKLVTEAIRMQRIAEIRGYSDLKTEVPYGDQRSRIDILLENQDESVADNRIDSNSGLAVVDSGKCFIEVKNVSLAVGQGRAVFPDAVTLRGQKHLQELMLMRRQGHRAVLFFCAQISDVEAVAPADAIDPGYGILLREAVKEGVEVLAYSTVFDIFESTITLNKRIAVDL